MSIVLDLKQALQDVLAPEIRANTQAIADLQRHPRSDSERPGNVEPRTHPSVRSIFQASEVRMLEGIKAAKTEMLLQLQVSLLTKQVEDLKAHQSTQ